MTRRMSEQLETPTIELLERAKRYVLTHMVWFSDTTFREPKLSDLGELIVNLIDDEIDRQRKHEEGQPMETKVATKRSFGKGGQMKFIVTDIHGVQREHKADHWRQGKYGLELVNQYVDYETVVAHYAKGRWISVVADEFVRLGEPCGWCEGDVSKYFDVCPNCGQTLDWSEE